VLFASERQLRERFGLPLGDALKLAAAARALRRGGLRRRPTLTEPAGDPLLLARRAAFMALAEPPSPVPEFSDDEQSDDDLRAEIGGGATSNVNRNEDGRNKTGNHSTSTSSSSSSSSSSGGGADT